MIAHICGKLTHKSLEYLIVDVNGVGYKIHIPLSTFYRLPDIDSSVKLNTYTHVREDQLQLYGFLTTQERDIFQLLIGVSGIGPKLAINILSGIPCNVLYQALLNGDTKKLSATPGVGKKTAQRMILELRDKIEGITLSDEPPTIRKEGQEEIDRDLIFALINLGYKKTVAEKALKEAKAAIKMDTYIIEDLLREALRVLSN
ncbi:MAG: Holliday junction branch migration protein RuvA [Thermodesulfobacteriota bacterium]|nr:Holliday junction branch migration protein RuvA [Thermodesulfobacteriota bacterium]